MTFGQILSVPPDQASLTLNNNATAWVFGSWVVAIANAATDIKIFSLVYSGNHSSLADITLEHIFEIGTGASGAEVTKLQIPVSGRQTSSAESYFWEGVWFMPEPYIVTRGNRIAVRVADSRASSLVYGVKLRYYEGAGYSVRPLIRSQAVNRAATY